MYICSENAYYAISAFGKSMAKAPHTLLND